MTEFKKLLLDYRSDNGLTQKELADKVGFPRDRINLWENGKEKPRAVHENKVRRILGGECDD